MIKYCFCQIKLDVEKSLCNKSYDIGEHSISARQI